VEELKAVPAEAEQDDEKWGDDNCRDHWRISVSSGPLVTLRLEGAEEAYLGAGQAEAIGRALLDAAKFIRDQERRHWHGAWDGITLELESHSGPPATR
jgi:hypothetical protein